MDKKNSQICPLIRLQASLRSSTQQLFLSHKIAVVQGNFTFALVKDVYQISDPVLFGGIMGRDHCYFDNFNN
jgi:hypothetical protein